MFDYEDRLVLADWYIWDGQGPFEEYYQQDKTRLDNLDGKGFHWIRFNKGANQMDF